MRFRSGQNQITPAEFRLMQRDVKDKPTATMSTTPDLDSFVK